MTTVEVWRIGLAGSDDAVDQLRETLDPAEIQRSQRFRFAEHRRRWVVCHGAVRVILGDYLGVHPAAVPWVTGPNGKPALGAGPYQINLSHSGDVALLAVSERPVGVDVEQVRDFDTASVSRHFSAAERSELSALDPPARARRFATLWTRKEALVKASGGRLGQGLPVRVPDSAGGDGAVVHSPQAHRVRDLTGVQPDYRAAVAVAGHESYEIRLHDWCWDGATEETPQ
jgi:4'-phosphopantetheinyl transferase